MRSRPDVLVLGGGGVLSIRPSASSNRTKSEILFLPFITKNHIIKYALGKGHRQEGYKMFDYVELTKLPHFRLNTQKKLWEDGSPEAEKNRAGVTAKHH